MSRGGRGGRGGGDGEDGEAEEELKKRGAGEIGKQGAVNLISDFKRIGGDGGGDFGF